MSEDLPAPPGAHTTVVQPATPVKPARSGRARLLMLLLPMALLAGAAWVVLHGGRYQSTENASVHQVRMLVAPDQSGRVTDSRVQDGAAVAAGDLLFVVDPEPLRIALAQADAALAAARLEVTGLQAAWQAALSKQELARGDLDYQTSEAGRQTTLTRRGVGSKSAKDESDHMLDRARQTMAEAEAGVQNAVAALGGNPDAPVDSHPHVQQAQAARDRAALALAQAEVRAPAPGIVTQAASFRPGQFVAAGTPVFSLMLTDQAWIEANFKETQLDGIAPGQSATVEFDALPGREYHAVVDTIAPGTGAEFSLLPAQNATGNWVKVTQRVPVRLHFAPDQDLAGLRSGLSATVTVDTGHQTRLQSLEQRLGRNGAAATTTTADASPRP